MDTEAIRVSAEWPKAIHRGLEQATHVIAVIGSQWLRVTDDYGRRRIDRDDDWVRAEIAHALQQRKRILPIVLTPDGMPRAEALPEEIENLAYVQPFELRNDRWESDLNLLVRELEKQGFERVDGGRRSLSNASGVDHGNSAKGICGDSAYLAGLDRSCVAPSRSGTLAANRVAQGI